MKELYELLFRGYKLDKREEELEKRLKFLKKFKRVITAADYNDYVRRLENLEINKNQLKMQFFGFDARREREKRK